LASILAAAVTLAAGTPLDTVCVFAPACIEIAKWLGVSEICQYTHVEDGWIRVTE
jgi:hypothetical protein